ncbi:MAG: GNAT family N-acetyltransferase [Pseudomonadota bacterium]
MSAATALSEKAEIPAAEAALRALTQPPLFLVRGWEEALDRQLSAQGYERIDPVAVLAAPTADLAPPAYDRVIVSSAPLALHRALFADAGLRAERLAVMARVAAPKAYLLGRAGDVPAATGFVAVASGVAMLHALTVAPAARRTGLGGDMVRAAAALGAELGADRLAVLVERENAAALALYARLGLREIAGYHYRSKPWQP